MIRKTLFSLMAITLAIGCISCSDESSSSKSEEDISCDVNTYKSFCDGDILNFCSAKKQTVVTGNCAERGDYTCAIFSQTESAEDQCTEDDTECLNNAAQAKTDDTCVAKSSACTQENEEIQRCETNASGTTYIRTYKCTKSADGRLFYRRSGSTHCYDGYGVCNEKAECTPPVPCEDDYVDHCDGSVLYQCSKNRFRTADCSKYSTPNSCAVINGKADCYAPSKECTEEGVISVRSCIEKNSSESLEICTKADDGKMYKLSAGTRKCIDSCNDSKTACANVACPTLTSQLKSCRVQGTYQTYVDSYSCTAAEDDKKYWTLDASELCDAGYGTCSETGECIPAETCVAKEFTNRCDEDVAVTCASKKVKYSHCENTEGSHCAIIEGKASCLDDSNLCENEGDEKISHCSTASNKEFYRICKTATNGKKYWVSNGGSVQKSSQILRTLGWSNLNHLKGKSLQRDRLFPSCPNPQYSLSGKM